MRYPGRDCYLALSPGSACREQPWENAAEQLKLCPVSRGLPGCSALPLFLLPKVLEILLCIWFGTKEAKLLNTFSCQFFYFVIDTKSLGKETHTLNLLKKAIHGIMA